MNEKTKKILKIIIFILGLILIMAVGIFFVGSYYANDKISKANTSLKFGFVADIEYGSKNSIGNKFPNKAPEGLEKMVVFSNDVFHPELIVVGGDVVESSLSKRRKVMQQLGEIDDILSKIPVRKEYIAGNHDLRKITKEEFRNTLNLNSNHKYFDVGDWRFILMDTNFKEDGSDMGPNHYVNGFVPESEFIWLREAFQTERPIILFSHHSSIPNKLSDGSFSTNTKNLKNGIELHNFLKQYDNLIVFVSGHEASFRHEKVDGIEYLINGNVVNKDTIGNFMTLNAKYNKYIKEVKVVVEKHGDYAGIFEINKKLGEFNWRDLFKGNE